MIYVIIRANLYFRIGENNRRCPRLKVAAESNVELHASIENKKNILNSQETKNTLKRIY